eukprot:scaffold3901_cov135-Skeletonema_menzelii.AAC.7
MDSILLSSNTHPIQLTGIAIMATIDIVVLFLLNKLKKTQSSAPQLSWEHRRNRFWTLIASSVAISIVLDNMFFPVDTKIMLHIKAYVMAFPLGLLDLYYSETKGVPMKVVVGAALWCSCEILRNFAVDCFLGRNIETIVMLKEFTPLTFVAEVIRATHHSSVYKHHHKSHHEYTNKLTALVIYHGNLLDDFLMPFTTTIGGFIYIWLLSQFGLESESFSNLTSYLLSFNILLSHAHDLRCARLLAPLPDAVNFVAYHYVHHISPSHNYGLTEPNQFWDYILGVKTIAKIGDFEQEKKQL